MKRTTAWHIIICKCYIVPWMGTPTILMGTQPLSQTAGPVSWGSKAQHWCVVLSELFEARDVPDVNAILKVGPHCNHGDLVRMTGFPRQQLGKMQQGAGI